ncbi:MAG: hypothetical protein M3Q72_05860 [Actinomycetota bacterium]|nr:hypothetical protein [Actinomycetota bacterium]
MTASEVAHLVATCVTGAVLVVSAVTKLVRRREWVQQATTFGAPAFVAPLVPYVELAVGALVATQLADPWPSWVAVALLAAFTAAIVTNLARGRHPPCACFGSLTPGPISWVDVARNTLLIVIALVAALTA